MIQNKHLSSSCWPPEDLEFIQRCLTQAFPAMGPGLRKAIVLLSMDEVRPREGREALAQRAVSFARHCPATSELNHVLAS
jgi:hypothetical protein